MAYLQKAVEIKNDIEATLFSQVLGENGIEYSLRSLHDSAYDGLYQSIEACWGYVYVNGGDLERTQKLFAEFRAAKPETD